MLKNRYYVASTGLVTCIILLIGGILWGTGSQRLSLDIDAVNTEAWYRGPANAPVRIDMFVDFSCSICLEKERMILQAVHDFSDSVQLVYHHYPDNPVSETVAVALEVAGEQDRFWEMHDRLVDNTSGDVSRVIRAAESVGLNVDEYVFAKIMDEAEYTGLDISRFTRNLGSKELKEKVITAKQQAISAGVEHAAVFINGKEYDKYPATYTDFYNTVMSELEELK